MLLGASVHTFRVWSLLRVKEGEQHIRLWLLVGCLVSLWPCCSVGVTSRSPSPGRAGCGPVRKDCPAKRRKGWGETITLMGGPSRRMMHLSGKRQHLPPGLIVGAFNKETRGGAAGPET